MFHLALALPRFPFHVPRRYLVALVIGALLPITAAAPVSAALGIKIVAYYGDCNFGGNSAGANKTIKLVWKDSSGSLKSTQTVKSKANGTWASRCEALERVEVGDTIKATIGTSSHLVTAPRLTASVDREANTVSGFGPVNSNTFQVDVYSYGGGFTITNHSTLTPSSGGTGAWSTDFTGLLDILGWDDVFVAWGNGHGDVFIRYETAPGLRVWLGRSAVTVAGDPGNHVQVDLSTSGSVLRASTSGSLDFYGYLYSEFPDADAGGVRPVAGDQVAADFAGDATFAIPSMHATGNVTSDKVAGQCPHNDGYLVRVLSPDGSKSQARAGKATSPTGTFTANFATAPTFDIRAGSKIDLYCGLPSGDVVARRSTVP
jgi:hypothetical protein